MARASSGTASEDGEGTEADTFDEGPDPSYVSGASAAPVGQAIMFRMKGALRHRMSQVPPPLCDSAASGALSDPPVVSASSTSPALSPVLGTPSGALPALRRGTGGAASPGESKARSVLRQLMKQKVGSPLRAWVTHFDKNLNGQCSALEFRAAMKALKYTGSAEALWEELDEEKLDEITLDIIDPESARLWLSFRKWCGATFDSPRDMIRQIRRSAGVDPSVEALMVQDFERGIVACGWDGGSEEELFEALDIEDEGCVRQRDLRWIDVEVRRREMKLSAKQRFMKERHAKAVAKLACQRARTDFKDFLQRQFGYLYHAWRRVLDQDGTMCLQKVELFKACRQLNWKGDVRALWRALDFDNSGSTTLEELDPLTAQLLAQLWEWAVAMFGAKPSASLWAAIDRRRSRKLSYQSFVQEMSQLGFKGRLKTVTRWLDWDAKRHVTEEDLRFFDRWKPPKWLVAKPNPEAAEVLKTLLKQRYGHHLKAWRSAMDKDNSNSCNWHEFVHAAQVVRFSGDIAGAWLHFDQTVCGSITFEDLDPGFHAVLMQFKQWCIDEFGGVRAAFKTIDTDGSNELTYKEFRLALREYGFPGDAAKLFASLDQSNEKRLQYKEIQFLDSWDLPSECGTTADEALEVESSTEPTRGEATMSTLLDYRTPNPGPGAYELAPCFGATPMTQTARHAGSWSFRGRGDRPPCWLTSAVTVGPAHYAPRSARDQENPERRRAPCWAQGRSERFQGGPFDVPTDALSSPGPGAYETKAAQGPQFSMGHRWLVTLHPTQRATSSVIAAFPMSGAVPTATPRRLKSYHCR